MSEIWPTGKAPVSRISGDKGGLNALRWLSHIPQAVKQAGPRHEHESAKE